MVEGEADGDGLQCRSESGSQNLKEANEKPMRSQ